MNKEFAIGIPTINRADLLNPALERYVTDFPNTSIFIIDNGNQQLFKHPNIKVFKQQENMGFTKSADMLSEYILMKGHKWVSLVNDDVEWGKKESEVLEFLKEAEEGDAAMFVSNYNWCNFLMKKSTYDKIGRWDYDFFNYFSDDDYSYRMSLVGIDIYRSRFLDPAIYRNSQSIAKDPSLNATQFDKDKQRFILKWGGVPGTEAYKVPYNGNK